METNDGVRTYFRSKIEELESVIRDKAANIRRLEAQRNELNTRGEALQPQCGVLRS
jgi:26S proteasome regulatory subunit T6